MDLHALRTYYEHERGYSRLNATARTCQDVVLSKLASSTMRDYVTVKGGILMCAISSNDRRATRDIDLDFLRYPLTNEAIRSFIETLSRIDDGVKLHIKGPIEELSQLDYKGRRVISLMQFSMILTCGIRICVELFRVLIELFLTASF